MGICGNKALVGLLFLFLRSFPVFTQTPTLLIATYQNNSTQSDSFHKNLSGDIPVAFLEVGDTSGQTVKAINEAVANYADPFDLLLVIERGDQPTMAEFDKVIVEAMTTHFPDFDGVLHFGERNSSSVIGREYYKRQGYVFYPGYTTSCFSLELMCVARILGKEVTLQQEIIRKGERPFSHIDEVTFFQRRHDHFGFRDTQLRERFPKDWSILICTLEERAEMFAHIYDKLSKQILDNQLEEHVEILFFKDNREHSVGKKRNALMRQSRGVYVNFIDDDDDVHENYIKMIYEKIQKAPDCISLHGIMTSDGGEPTPFIHSIQYDHYFNSGGTYYRPPNHLNVIRRVIASQFLFPLTSFGEDTDWAMQIAGSYLLKKEEKLSDPYYFYQYISGK